MRFVLAILICAIIGFSVWWFLSPELLLAKPAALFAPDLKLLFKVVDTFFDHVCSSHPKVQVKVSSPCDCDEPLNKTAKDLFAPQETFDPLELNNTHRAARLKALPVFMASIR